MNVLKKNQNVLSAGLKSTPIKIILLVLFNGAAFSAHVSAQTSDQSVRVSEAKTPSDSWVIKDTLSRNISGADKINVTSKESAKEILSYSPTHGGFFDRGSVVMIKGFERPLLITEWTNGARSLMLKIFDPLKTQKPVFETSSLSSLKYTITGGAIEVTTYRESDSQEAEPKEVVTVFRPKK